MADGQKINLLVVISINMCYTIFAIHLYKNIKN